MKGNGLIGKVLALEASESGFEPQLPYAMNNVYFENGIIHFYGEEIDINSVPDIMGRNCQQKFTNYVKWRLKGHDIRLNKF